MQTVVCGRFLCLCASLALLLSLPCLLRMKLLHKIKMNLVGESNLSHCPPPKISPSYLLLLHPPHILEFISKRSLSLPHHLRTMKFFTKSLLLIPFLFTLSTTMSDATFFSATKAAGTTVEVDFGDKTILKKHAIAYWSIRGLGAPLTMMMCAAKYPFTLFLYDIVEQGENGWNSDYFAAKGGYIKEFKQPLWNLPFCVDRENKRVITQTNAIFAHLGRACGMFGEDEIATSECEQLLSEIYDLRNVMTDYAYGGNDADASSVLATGKTYLNKLEQWLEIQAEKMGQNQVVHLVNGKYSGPDFYLYEMLDQFQAFAEENKQDLYTDLKRIKEFKEGFEALPENQFYLNSWLHNELPFNNCMAKFGSLPGPKTYVHGDSAKDAAWRGKGVVDLSP